MLAAVRWGTVFIGRPPQLLRLAERTAPSWSPDGRQIAFIASEGRVDVIPARGGRAHQVGRLHGRSVDWQPIPVHRTTRCLMPPGSVVVADSPDALVSRGGVTAPFSLDGPQAFMGCVTATGRSRLLARYTFESYDSEQGAAGAATAGAYAALATCTTDYHYGGSSGQLAVYDLRLLHHIHGSTHDHRQRRHCSTYRPNAVLAIRLWLRTDPSRRRHRRTHRRPAASTSPLQADPSPTLTDLALSGNTLTWKHAGASQTTTLR